MRCPLIIFILPLCYSNGLIISLVWWKTNPTFKSNYFSRLLIFALYCTISLTFHPLFATLGLTGPLFAIGSPPQYILSCVLVGYSLITLTADWSESWWWPDSLTAALLEWRSIKCVVIRAGQVAHSSWGTWCLSTAILNYYVLSNSKRTTRTTYISKKKRWCVFFRPCGENS